MITLDNSTIVIERVHTSLFKGDELKNLVEKEECELPAEIVKRKNGLDR